MTVTPERAGHPKGTSPTGWLVLEVLAARRRLGESTWSFPTMFRPTLRRLEASGLVGFKSSVAEGAFTAWLTDEGWAAAISPTYEPPAEPDSPFSMTTWKRVDGELIYGDYSFSTDRPTEDAACSDTPVEYRKQAWALVSDEVDVIEPTHGYCQHEEGDGPCEDDDVTWQKDGAGHWIALCPQHSADVLSDRGEAGE